ncbi:MAG: patatin-like phospholipase family protein [candidate division Zixibacteria bacterium]
MPSSESITVKKLGICLSGGGYRAALFHLGVLRRLNELGLLTQADTISSVSGGSIMSAHLAQAYVSNPPGQGPYPNWEETIAQPFRKFCQRDIRTAPILKRLFLPWCWFQRSTQVNALMSRYEKHLTRIDLSQLPQSPQFVFCATDVVFGVNWEFKSDKVGDYLAGEVTTPKSWKVARAVAASSCFPPLFGPMPVGKDFVKEKRSKTNPPTDKDKLLSKIRLSDGGLYDNLGLEPAKHCDIVIASDGGAPFRAVKPGSPFRLLARYFDITANQVGALRKRWLMDDFRTQVSVGGDIQPKRQGTILPIDKRSTNRDDPAAPGYEKDLVDKYISSIRTDLDGFTSAEIGVLENHGYLIADRVIKNHTPELVTGTWPKLEPPHPEMLDPDFVKDKLKNSSKRFSASRILGKLFGGTSGGDSKL